MVDAPDLGSGVLRRVGSSPITRTIGQKRIIRENFPLFYFCNSLIIERLSRGLHSHQRVDNCLFPYPTKLHSERADFAVFGKFQANPHAINYLIYSTLQVYHLPHYQGSINFFCTLLNHALCYRVFLANPYWSFHKSPHCREGQDSPMQFYFFLRLSSVNI